MPTTPTPADRPADLLRAAAEKLRAAAAAVPSDDWGTRPWHVEECSDTDTMESCPCIVAQGEHKEFDQPQVPLIQYVADAETPEHAAYIVLMHPGVGLALAVLLDAEALRYDRAASVGEFDASHERPLAVARQLLGTSVAAECGCDPAPHREDDGTYSHWAGCPIADEQQAADLTADEARVLADELNTELYQVRDALAFVGECCDIADREQRTVTTGDVREWLKGARCGRQLLGTTSEGGEQGAPVNWEAIARQRERELKAVGEAGHAAENAAKRLRAELEESRAVALSRCRTLDEHDATTALPAPADRAALTEAEQTMLNYALNQAQLRIWSGHGSHTEEDQAALVSLRRLADDAAAGVQPPTTGEADTLAPWLYRRFMVAGVGWNQLDEDDRSYWEHHARAVRRAVARGGFRTPATCTCDFIDEPWIRMQHAATCPAAPAVPEEPTWAGATELASDREIARVAAAGVVGYRQNQGRLLHCLAHKPAPASRYADFHEVGADDLDDGGICVYRDCGRDLLAAWPTTPEETQ
ncbi:hypothetical protein ACF07M_20240 [Streptomyces globisporus]|uniref:hypothetical protein n=1 Tax=Streptomyces globisporus TaxID=1908 RepID=UPI0036F89CCF